MSGNAAAIAEAIASELDGREIVFAGQAWSVELHSRIPAALILTADDGTQDVVILTARNAS